MIGRFGIKTGMLLAGDGALIYLTSHDSFVDQSLVDKFEAKGITKFIAYEIPVDEAKNRYGKHLDIVVQDLRETNDLRILDYTGCQAFKMYSFKELVPPFMHEKEESESTRK